MIEQAKNICIELLRSIKNPTTQDINNAIDNVLKIFPGLDSERESLYNYLSATFSVFSEDYRILDTDEGYTPWLKDKKANVEWNFWNRYVNYLQKKIAPDTINKLDNLTDDILDRIANPINPPKWYITVIQQWSKKNIHPTNYSAHRKFRLRIPTINIILAKNCRQRYIFITN